MVCKYKKRKNKGKPRECFIVSLIFFFETRFPFVFQVDFELKILMSPSSGVG